MRKFPDLFIWQEALVRWSVGESLEAIAEDFDSVNATDLRAQVRQAMEGWGRVPPEAFRSSNPKPRHSKLGSPMDRFERSVSMGLRPSIAECRAAVDELAQLRQEVARLTHLSETQEK